MERVYKYSKKAAFRFDFVPFIPGFLVSIIFLISTFIMGNTLAKVISATVFFLILLTLVVLINKKPLREDEPQLIINSEGILDLARKRKLIRWQDIKELYLGGSYLRITLVDPDRYFGYRHWLRRFFENMTHSLGGGDLIIAVSALDVGDWDNFNTEIQKDFASYRNKIVP